MVGRFATMLLIIARVGVAALDARELGLFLHRSLFYVSLVYVPSDGSEYERLLDLTVASLDQLTVQHVGAASPVGGKVGNIDELEKIVRDSRTLNLKIEQVLRGGRVRSLGEAAGQNPSQNRSQSQTETVSPSPTSHCSDREELLQKCKQAIEKSEKFMKQMTAESEELVPNKENEQTPSLLSDASEMLDLGESALDSNSEEAESPWCVDTLLMLRDCRDQLYQVSAFLEHMGTHGSPRPGFPGSKVPAPHINATDVVHGSSNDPNVTGVIDQAKIVEVEKICSSLEAHELLKDDPAYKNDKLKHQQIDQDIISVLSNRVSWWDNERQQKGRQPEQPDNLPTCQGCWMRRRRANNDAFGEVNSCSPIPPTPPPSAPTSAPTEEQAQVPEPNIATAASNASKPTDASTSLSPAPPAPDAPEAYSVKSAAPDVPEGYSVPVAAQGKWFYGLLQLHTGTWACNSAVQAVANCGSTIGDNLPCDTKGPGDSVLDCKAKCDTCSSCTGFNFVKIPYMDKVGKGGMCVYMSKDPTQGAVSAFSQCAPLPVNQTTCSDPKEDPKFYCCEYGAYYQKIKAQTLPPCPTCCTELGSNKCEGPTCQKCTPAVSSIPGCQPSAKPCCNSDCTATSTTCSPPCGDASCAGCTTVKAEMPAAIRMKTLPGTGFKFNMEQPTTVPKHLEAYSNPPEMQGKFFFGAVQVPPKGGGATAATCNVQLTSSSAELKSAVPSCLTQLTSSSGVETCKTYCDNDNECKGFNYVYNSYSTNKWQGSSGSYDIAATPVWTAAPVNLNPSNNGGMCIFFSKNPEAVQTSYKSCGDWQGESPVCLEPYTDSKWYCCRAAYYYHKTHFKNGNPTDGSGNVNSAMAAESAVADGTCLAKATSGPKCKWHQVTKICASDSGSSDGNCAKQTDETSCSAAVDNPDSRCVFPFVYNGKTYTKCSTNGQPDRKPWCATALKAAVDDEGSNVETSGLCSVHCDTVCTATETNSAGQAKKGFECQFPFYYTDDKTNKTQASYKCIPSAGYPPWCYTGAPCVWKGSACVAAWQDGVQGDQCIGLPQSDCTNHQKNTVAELYGVCEPGCDGVLTPTVQSTRLLTDTEVSELD